MSCAAEVTAGQVCSEVNTDCRGASDSPHTRPQSQSAITRRTEEGELFESIRAAEGSKGAISLRNSGLLVTSVPVTPSIKLFSVFFFSGTGGQMFPCFAEAPNLFDSSNHQVLTRLPRNQRARVLLSSCGLTLSSKNILIETKQFSSRNIARIIYINTTWS